VSKLIVLALCYSALLITPLLADAKRYVIENQNQLVHKSVAFIEQLSGEVFAKTGVSLYVATLETLGDNDIQGYRETIRTNLQSPYIAVIFVNKEKKIDLFDSGNLETFYDKKDVYWNYIVPLIPKSQKELTPQSISAMILNGYVEIADSIALANNVTLEHSFPKEDKGTKVLVRFLLYAMLFILLILFLLSYTKRRIK